MSTTTVKTIGTASRDYSTIASWEAACPSNLTTSISGGEIWQGQCYNDGAFSEHASIAGQTTDSTGYVHLTVASGQSIFDTASNALFYDASLGAKITVPDRYGSGVSVNSNYAIVERLQANYTDNAYNYGCFYVFDGSPTNVTFRRLLSKVNTNKAFNVQSNSLKVINCVAICGTSATGFDAGTTTTSLINCTAVVPTGTSANGTGFAGGSASLNNCAAFGFTNATSGSPSSGNYNATSAASGMPGANSQHSLTYANQFVSTTVDFKLKTGSNLIGGGNTDATNAPNDIYGTARGSGTAGDVGAHEFVSGGGGSYTITAAQGSYALTGQSAALRAARQIAAAQGSYTLTGQAAALRRGLKITAAQGSYALTGNDAGLRHAFNLLAGQGAYVLTGQDATLTYVPAGGGNKVIKPEAGMYALTGQAAALRVDRRTTAAQGSYTLTGQDITFKRSYALQAGHGLYVVSGQDAALNYSAAPPSVSDWITRARRKSIR